MIKLKYLSLMFWGPLEPDHFLKKSISSPKGHSKQPVPSPSPSCYSLPPTWLCSCDVSCLNCHLSYWMPVQSLCPFSAFPIPPTGWPLVPQDLICSGLELDTSALSALSWPWPWLWHRVPSASPTLGSTLPQRHLGKTWRVCERTLNMGALLKRKKKEEP